MQLFCTTRCATLCSLRSESTSGPEWLQSDRRRAARRWRSCRTLMRIFAGATTTNTCVPGEDMDVSVGDEEPVIHAVRQRRPSIGVSARNVTPS